MQNQEGRPNVETRFDNGLRLPRAKNKEQTKKTRKPVSLHQPIRASPRFIHNGFFRGIPLSNIDHKLLIMKCHEISLALALGLHNPQ